MEMGIRIFLTPALGLGFFKIIFEAVVFYIFAYYLYACEFLHKQNHISYARFCVYFWQGYHYYDFIYLLFCHT